MSEKPNDGAVAIHIGEIEDAEDLTAEDFLPTLPNTVSLNNFSVCCGHGLVNGEEFSVSNINFLLLIIIF